MPCGRKRKRKKMKKHRAVKWLSDDRAIGPFSREDQEWCENVWFPKIRDAGWKYWAIVLPEKALGQMSLHYFIKKYSEQGITAELFDNPEDAYDWLLEQPAQVPVESLLPLDHDPVLSSVSPPP